MTADDLVTRSLAMLGDSGLDDAELDRRVTRFRDDLLRRLRRDPAEAARIDAMVVDAERAQAEQDAARAGGLRIYVADGGVVNIDIYDGEIARSFVCRKAEATTVAEDLTVASPGQLADEILVTTNAAEERLRRRWRDILPTPRLAVTAAAVLLAVVVALSARWATGSVVASSVVGALGGLSLLSLLSLTLFSVRALFVVDREASRRARHIVREALYRRTNAARDTQDAEPAGRRKTGSDVRE